MRLFGDRVVVAALEGWSDAAEASSAAVEWIRTSGEYEAVFSVDPELYFDYQYTRPATSIDAAGDRMITWPETTLWRPVNPATDGADEVWLLTGVEPARLWQSYTAELVDVAHTYGISGLITLGAMMSDPPHSRPLPVHRTSDNAALRERHGIERSQYEGPTGVLTVLQLAFEKADIPSLAIWTTVPHYSGAQTPSPKATLALLEGVATHVPIADDRTVLEAQAARWEAELDVMVAETPDLAAYVAELERTQDQMTAPEASGESLAAEFERYLRRDGDGPQRP